MTTNDPEAKLAKAFHDWLADSPVDFSVQYSSAYEAYTVTFFLKPKSESNDA